jgi:hypothetical protein
LGQRKEEAMMKNWRLISIPVILLITAILFLIIGVRMSKADETEGKVKTVYDITGRPVNQDQDAKGYHRISGTLKLVAGLASTSLNTNINDGRQDVSFINETTYHGQAWSLDSLNTNSYTVYPMSGIVFIIKSSNGADTATVQFMVEGE